MPIHLYHAISQILENNPTLLASKRLLNNLSSSFDLSIGTYRMRNVLT